MKVELSEEAHAQVQEIDAWWPENRCAAPDLFADELDQALLMLEQKPMLGTHTTWPEQRPCVACFCVEATIISTSSSRPSGSTSSRCGACIEDEGRSCRLSNSR